MWGGVLGPTRRWTFEGRVTSVMRRRVFEFFHDNIFGGRWSFSSAPLHLAAASLAASRAPHGMRSVIVDRASPSSMQSACNQHAISMHSWIIPIALPSVDDLLTKHFRVSSSPLPRGRARH